MQYSVPLELGQTYTLRLGYQRFTDSGDPANDGLTAGIDWYNGFNNKIGETVVHSDNTLLVSSLRREFSYSLGFPGGEVYDVYIPQSARYGIAWYRVLRGRPRDRPRYAELGADGATYAAGCLSG